MRPDIEALIRKAKQEGFTLIEVPEGFQPVDIEILDDALDATLTALQGLRINKDVLNRSGPPSAIWDNDRTIERMKSLAMALRNMGAEAEDHSLSLDEYIYGSADKAAQAHRDHGEHMERMNLIRQRRRKGPPTKLSLD